MVPPKTPYGGGFGMELFTLSYLYEEYRFHNNYWTTSNLFKDLCRYLWCKIIFYRDPKTDFIVAYDTQPPFNLTKWTYPGLHPQQLMLAKHKKFVLSKRTNPKGKLTVKFKIRPTKQMISKWFFSKTFCKYPLVCLKAAACDLNASFIGCCNENPQLGFFYINHGFYQLSDWGMNRTNAYIPYSTVSETTYFKYKNETISIKKNMPYSESISYDKGWFQTKILLAQGVCTSESCTTFLANKPTNVAFYNPTTDNGEGNEIYLTSIITGQWHPPTSDNSILITGLPLWMAIYGFFSYVKQIKADKKFLDSHCLIIRSPSIFPASQIGTQNFFLPISKSFVEGKGPYNQPATSTQKTKWFPSIIHQTEILNIFVQSGPYIPKYNDQKESNWELKFKYNFCFKFGGPQMHDTEVTDPNKQDKYDVPDTVQQRLQITDPEKQSPESLLHQWDYRRGFVKEAALKRMADNLSIDTDFQADTELHPKKRQRRGPQLTVPEQEEKEIKTCLLSLCEENIFQEPKTQEEIQQLIVQQQQQQHQLKRDLLHLLADLKQQQQMLQLQTGIIP